MKQVLLSPAKEEEEAEDIETYQESDLQSLLNHNPATNTNPKDHQPHIITMDSIGLDILKGVVFIYDATTLPIYFLVQKPWKKKKKSKVQRAAPSVQSDPSSPWTRIGKPAMTMIDDCRYVHEVFTRAVEKFRGNKCMATRAVLVEEQEKLPDGSLILRKTLANDYKWYNYNQIDKRVDDVVKGMMAIGIKEGDMVLIHMETRIEWMIVCQAIFRLNAIPVTIYPTIDDLGLISVIEETKLNHIFTSSDLLVKIKLLRGKNKLTTLTNLVYIEDHLDNINSESLGFMELNVNCVKLNKLESMGAKSDAHLNKMSHQQPSTGGAIKLKSPDDTALIMYTAGTSGAMKGVQFSHLNLISAIRSMSSVVNQLKLKPMKDVSINYLPLSSSFEFVMENVLIMTGIGIAYSSPSTLTDLSPTLKDGTVGDINIIEPSSLLGVPLILDRLKKGINEQVAKKGTFFGKIFDFALDYKLYWTRKGYSTPIVNMFLCNKVIILVS